MNFISLRVSLCSFWQLAVSLRWRYGVLLYAGNRIVLKHRNKYRFGFEQRYIIPATQGAPMDRQELLANLEAGRERLEAAMERIEPMQVMEPGLHDSWSVKDLLAHLGWWEQRVVDIYDALLHNRA